jgi:ATP diphosphatase
VQPEEALRGTNTKFIRRFAHIERHARNSGRSLTELTLEEMEELWQAAKQTEQPPADIAKDRA